MQTRDKNHFISLQHYLSHSRRVVIFYPPSKSPAFSQPRNSSIYGGRDRVVHENIALQSDSNTRKWWISDITELRTNTSGIPFPFPLLSSTPALQRASRRSLEARLFLGVGGADEKRSQLRLELDQLRHALLTDAVLAADLAEQYAGIGAHFFRDFCAVALEEVRERVDGAAGGRHGGADLAFRCGAGRRVACDLQRQRGRDSVEDNVR